MKQKRESLFLFYIENSIGLFVIGLDHDRVGEPVEHPELGARHPEPSNQAVERQDKCLAETLDCCRLVMDLRTVAVDDLEVHHHLADGLSPALEPLHDRPVGKEEEGLEPEFEGVPPGEIQVLRDIPEGEQYLDFTRWDDVEVEGNYQKRSKDPPHDIEEEDDHAEIDKPCPEPGAPLGKVEGLAAILDDSGGILDTGCGSRRFRSAEWK